MRIHPAVAALREAPFSQRQPSSKSEAALGAAALREAHKDWLASAQTRFVLEDMGSYAEGAPLQQCFLLGDLLSRFSAARAFVDPILHTTLALMSQHRLGETPFNFRISQGFATIQLASQAGVTLSLIVYEPLPQSQKPSTALFSDCDVHEVVLEGAASGMKHHRRSDAEVKSNHQTWRAGDTITLDGRAHARDVVAVESAFSLLRLTREPNHPKPTQLVSLETGHTLHTASGDKSASQAVMALSVLGALQDDSALDVMAQTALNPEEDPDVRWEAVRQVLAISAAQGLSLLEQLGARSSDPLSNPALSLRTTLLANQPELRALIEQEAA